MHQPFLHCPLHGPPHLGVTLDSLLTGLTVAQPPFSLFPGPHIIVCEGTTSTSQHAKPQQHLIAYQVMHKTLAYKAKSFMFWPAPLSSLLLPTLSSMFQLNLRSHHFLTIFQFLPTSQAVISLLSLPAAPAESSNSSHTLPYNFYLNPQSLTQETPCFCSPFMGIYFLLCLLCECWDSGWGSGVHLVE